MSHRHEHSRERPPEPSLYVGACVQVAFNRGEGCCEFDPVRRVIAYYMPDGTLLAEHDPTARTLTVNELAAALTARHIETSGGCSESHMDEAAELVRLYRQ